MFGLKKYGFVLEKYGFVWKIMVWFRKAWFAFEKVWFDQILEKTGGEGKSILPLTVLRANIWASSTYRHIDIKDGNLFTRGEDE